MRQVSLAERHGLAPLRTYCNSPVTAPLATLPNTPARPGNINPELE
ncbi:MAG TPA: hypothetical protein VFS20_18250 [Longimicrobium sp.]|nr:hypothetical protein [Longimicrobium sp.]